MRARLTVPRCHMWVECVVGSRIAPRVFHPGSAVFLLSQKPTFPISNLITIEDPNENQLRLIISYYNFFFKFTSDSNRNRVKSKVKRIKNYDTFFTLDFPKEGHILVIYDHLKVSKQKIRQSIVKHSQLLYIVILESSTKYSRILRCCALLSASLKRSL